jgi:hypothetical protein
MGEEAFGLEAGAGLLAADRGSDGRVGPGFDGRLLETFGSGERR